jgi:hypothetical protein
MNSAGAVPIGNQRPRFRTVPEGTADSWGPEAIDLAATVGVVADEGQRDVITDGMAHMPDGKWLASEVADIEPRQNGKGVDLEIRALAGLLLVKEPLIIWTAHEFKTANEGFLRMRHYFDNYDHLRKRVRTIRSSTHSVEIILLGGQRLAFLARSGGSGRGFAGVAPLFLDEAFALTAEQMAALIFAMSAHPNPQVWYMSSAPLVDSEVLRDICARGRRGSVGLVYYEWSSSGEHKDLETLVADNKALSDEEAANGPGRELRAQLFAKAGQANRALGVRIQPSSILRELKATGVEQFLRERLGVYVENLAGEGFRVIPSQAWTGALDPRGQIDGRPAIGVYVPPDRSYSAIAAAGARVGGGRLIEVTSKRDGTIIDHRPGARWIVGRLKEINDNNDPSVIVVDDQAIAEECEAAGIEVHRASVGDVVTGCQMLFDGIAGPDEQARDVHHLGQDVLTTAASGAAKRKVGNSWAWDRHEVTVDIAPLPASSLALFGHSTPRIHRQEAVAPWAMYA